ncbi:MAG: hypothetical protein HRF50_04400 [Phycisphaerae bacterium]|jgi:hypothetical protein
MAMTPGQVCLRLHPIFGKLATYGQGTRWFVFVPLGTSGHPLGDWLRYEFTVPYAIAGQNSLTYPSLKGVMRGRCYSGVRASWEQFSSQGGSNAENGGAGYFSASLTQMNAAADFLSYVLPSPLSTRTGRLYRIAGYKPATQRSDFKVEHRTSAGVQQTDLIPCWHAGGEGPFYSAWRPFRDGCDRLRVYANVYGGSSYDLRYCGFDVIDLATLSDPDATASIGSHTVQGALFYDGDDVENMPGAALEVVPFANKFVEQLITSFPTNHQIVVYHDAGSGGHLNGARSFGGLSHRGVDGGTIQVQTQGGANGFDDISPASIGEAHVADLIRVGVSGANFYLQSDLGGGVMGTLDSEFLIGEDGCRLNDVATYTASGRIYDHYTTLLSIAPSWRWVRFGNQPALVHRDPAAQAYAARKCDSLIADLGDSGLILYQADNGNECRASDYPSFPRISSSDGSYKTRFTRNVDANGTIAVSPGSKVSSRAVIRFIDRALFWRGGPGMSSMLM